MTIKTILSACFSLVFAVWVSAQTPAFLSPNAQQHLAQHAPQLLKQLQQLAQHAPQNKVQDRGDALLLDSTVTYFNYSANDSTPQFKSVFSYPSDVLSVETTYANQSGQWQPYSRSAQHFDALGRTIRVLSETYHPTKAWIPESRLEVYPHGDSQFQADSFIVSVWDTTATAWLLALQNSTSFDNQDRPVVIFTLFNEFLGQSFALLDELEYDANGDNHLTIQSLQDQGVWIPFTRIDLEYEQHREVLQTSSLIIDEQTSFPQSRIETSYTPEGLTSVVKSFSFDPISGGWTLDETTGYLYDAQNRVISQVDDIPSVSDPERNWIQYDYVEGENLRFEAHYLWDFAGTNSWVVTDKTFYYYGNTTAGHEAVNAGPLPLAPNPSTGLVRLPALNKGLVTVLNTQGQAVQPAQTQLQDGLLDLSNLPAGLYYISVQDGANRQTGALVKQ
ncbi:MAG: T9SS type A sorting domain-containing protein [Saprospiraceae bacterium]|nr:T9SS type A sorting domain-containing protein [Saprospiraceae bacterium]